MTKTTNILKKTHAYILDDGTVVRAISEAHITEYQKDKVTVYSCPASKTVDGVKVESTNYYVPIDKFVKRTTGRTSKLQALLASVDLTSMTAVELAAMLKG